MVSLCHQASEMTYPVGEETSATLLVVFFSAVQLAFIGVGSYISAAVMNWGNVLTLGVATALLALPNIRSAGRSACPKLM